MILLFPVIGEIFSNFQRGEILAVTVDYLNKALLEVILALNGVPVQLLSPSTS